MPEPVELRFEESGVDPMIDKIERLAKALDALPKNGIVKVAVSGGSGGAPMPTRAPSTAAMLNPVFQGGGTSVPIPANATPGAYRTQATAVAKAAASATGNIQGLASALGSLHPVATLAVAGITAIAAGVASFQQRNLSSIQADFMWGKAGGASARGIAEGFGKDPVVGPQNIQAAIDGDADVKSAAIRAGINPSGSIYGGDTNLAKKYKDFLDYLSDKNRGGKDRQWAAYIANKAGVGDEVARLSAMKEPDRQKALNSRVDVSEEDQSNAASRDQKWNHAKAGLDYLWARFADEFTNGAAKDWLDRLGGGGPDASSKKTDAKSDGPKSAAAKMDDAAEKMGRAAETFSQAAEGIGGGGARSRNALPPGWGYTHYDHAARGDAARLGIT